MNKKEAQEIISNHLPFSSMLFELIKALLLAENIKYHIVEYRTKTIESLEEKIQRKKIEDYKKEILDITGLRIILYYQDDLDKVEDLINQNFIVDPENSVDKESLFKSNEFGYLSRHYIVQLNKDRSKLVEWKKYVSLKAEIQVRTVLQHSWASISHELSYKKNYEIPKELQRKLFGLAGLFELADEQFLVIRNNHEKLKLEVTNLSVEEISDEEINILTLRKNIALTDAYTKIIETASNQGFSVDYDTDKTNDRYLSGVKLICNYLELETIREFEKVVLSIKSKEYKALYKNMMNSSSNETWSGPVVFLMMVALFLKLSENQLEKFSIEWNWDNELWKVTLNAVKQAKNKG